MLIPNIGTFFPNSRLFACDFNISWQVGNPQHGHHLIRGDWSQKTHPVFHKRLKKGNRLDLAKQQRVQKYLPKSKRQLGRQKIGKMYLYSTNFIGGY